MTTERQPTQPPGDDVFPAPVFKDTVLAPLFEGAKAHFVDAFRRVDQAHCVMLAETKVLSQAQASAIAMALAATQAELDLANTPYTGEVEDLFFLVEAALKARLAPDLAGRLHTGRSRNDMDHTVFKMVLKQKIDAFLEKSLGLASGLIKKIAAERATLIVAYTHGQPAQPTTFGHYLAAYLEILMDDVARLQAAREIVDRSPMGAAAITTSGFGLDRVRMAELLGFNRIRNNSYGAIASIDYVTAPYSAVKLMMLHLGRLIQDFQMWSAFEVGQLYVPDGFVQISSIMPQKRNPVPIEHARLLASLAAGRAETAIMTMHNTPFTDMNDGEGEVQAASHAAFIDAGRAVDLVGGLIRAVSINEERVRHNLARSSATITELADTLVRHEGLSFRQAHHIASDVAKAVVAAGTTLADGGFQPFVTAFETHAGRPNFMSLERFQEVVSPEHFIKVRTMPGGPAPGAMREALAGLARDLDRLDTVQRANQKREADAKVTLDLAFTNLVNGRI